ncbi:PH domain-containing protein [Halarcobacter anaerophilus]|uniref:PH domain-containing protein n=1 Tax=Halarcobacter anaerophilus TaxID=877500 RepID=UPI000696C79D|nr:PH domain-containing protein [Halarcobacter anaerophilus]
MKYVENNLMPGEKVLFVAKIHWIVYLFGSIIFLLGVLSPFYKEIKTILVFIGLFFLIKAFIFVKTTELVITSKRVIAKFGLIRRNTIELNHSQVESLMVDQGIIDRIVNAGTILIQGTGGSRTPIPSIIKPLDFRKEYFNITEQSK